MNAKIKSHAKTITKFFTCYNIVACLWSMGKRGEKSQRKNRKTYLSYVCSPISASMGKKERCMAF